MTNGNGDRYILWRDAAPAIRAEVQAAVAPLIERLKDVDARSIQAQNDAVQVEKKHIKCSAETALRLKRIEALVKYGETAAVGIVSRIALWTWRAIVLFLMMWFGYGEIVEAIIKNGG